MIYKILEEVASNSTTTITSSDSLSYDSLSIDGTDLIAEIYNKHWYLLEGDTLLENEKRDFVNITEQKGDMSELIAASAIDANADVGLMNCL